MVTSLHSTSSVASSASDSGDEDELSPEELQLATTLSKREFGNELFKQGELKAALREYNLVIISLKGFKLFGHSVSSLSINTNQS